MRRFAGIGLILIFLMSLGLSGCGGGGGSSSGVSHPTVATVELKPSQISLEPGQVAQVAALAKDSADKPIFTVTFTYSSSNPNITVSNNGLVCAGIWDSVTTPVVCKTTDSNNNPLPIPATANLTATTQNITSNAVPVFVHLHVSSITLSPASVDCLSQNGTQIFTATVFNGATDITSTVGNLSWSSSETTVATIDVSGPSTSPVLTGNQAQVKAKGSGISNISAFVAGTNSVSAPFTTCSPSTIFIHVKDTTDTSFTVAVNSGKQLAADVVDILGNPVTGLNLTWVSSQPTIATTDTTGGITGKAPGISIITASCTPSTCNAGTGTAVYSNPVTVTVTGTATTTTAYATTTAAPASGAHSDLIPINTSNNTAGTAIAMPADAQINSLLINPQGTRAFLGSSKGLVVVDITTNNVLATITNAPGRVLAVSPNGQFVVTTDTGTNSVYVFDTANNLVTTLGIPGATGASFTTDSFKAYIVAGSTLFQYSPSLTLRTIPMTTAANDVAVNLTGQFAYIAGGEASSVAARSTCRNDSTWAPEDVVAVTATPDFIESVSTGDLVAVEGSTSTMDKVTPTITAPGAGSCPPTLSDSLATKNWNTDCCGIASFTPRQIIVTPDGAKAFVTSDQTVLLGYNIGANTTFSVALSGGATAFTGGSTIDSTKVYVGGSDNKVHVIDVAGGTESATVSLSFTPQLVAVRPQ